MTSGLPSFRRTDRSAVTAARYREEFPWADQRAIQIALLLFDTAADQSNAVSRFFASMGEVRTRGRYTALRILYFAHGRRLSQNDIRAEMNVSSANVTYLIDELQKEGLVKRTPNPADRRAIFVELTPEGERVCSVMVPGMARFMVTMCEGFADEEKDQLLDMLQRLQRNALEAYREESQAAEQPQNV